ncbi:MAG TPA: hypothetical protein VN838_30505 [Bradyrhizobium sp.]|nr:hypothetical protein [Bradyrhizobium sp.]
MLRAVDHRDNTVPDRGCCRREDRNHQGTSPFRTCLFAFLDRNFATAHFQVGAPFLAVELEFFPI